MRNNINNNIIAVWLLAGLVLVFSQSKPQLPLNGYIEGNMRIVGNAPKIGEIFDVVYQITTLNTKDWTIRKDYLTKDYAIVMRAGYPEDAVVIIGDNKFIFSGLAPGEQREFHIKCRIVKPVNRININGDIHIIVNGEISGPITTTHGFLFLYLIDPISGQYGTSEEYEGKFPIEYRYDPLVGTFTCSPSQNPAPIEENRMIIKMIRQLEPALGDSEILLLHSEQYRVGIPKGISKWDEKEKRWTEEKIFEYYLKDGWLKALRYNNLPEWELREKTKIDREWKKEGSFNFFRDGYNRYDGDSIDSRGLGSYYDTTSFQGGPYCEGAVCGSLWDIYDSKNEIPYHSYPDTLDGVWFPDSALKDSLTMGFDEIWYIFDNYDPAGTPTNCWTIYDFRSGWNIYNYDHAFALNQILLHHRIRDSVPAMPTGLSVTQVQYYARLWWNMNMEADLEGYRIYRRYSDGYDWSEWAFLTEKTSPTDTTHDDFTVQAYRTYQYKLTAYDSLRNESAYSDSFQIYIDYWWNPDRVDPTVHLPTIITDKYGMELSLTSGSCDVELKVYDCCGRLVNKKTIKLTANNFTKVNLRTDARNNRLPCGIYFLSIEFDKNETIQRKFIILK